MAKQHLERLRVEVEVAMLAVEVVGPGNQVETAVVGRDLLGNRRIVPPQPLEQAPAQGLSVHAGLGFRQ
jgi:hypothetical protein